MEAIRAAKKGVYSAKKLAEVPPELVARYFEREGDAFILDQSIRDEVDFVQGDIFAQHFDKAFDFVSCRNLMIYLKREQQDQLIHHLHQQMNSGAGFVIGLTESLSPAGLKLFSTLDHFHRIFKRR
ncbi:CheR family methyltransferase [Oceanospirillum sp. HFRX-1_2]